MVNKHVVYVEAEVTIWTTEEGEAGIERYVDLPKDNEWQVTPGMSKNDVLEWIATSCVAYGRHDANQDGWADLNPGAFSADVTYVSGAQ